MVQQPANGPLQLDRVFHALADPTRRALLAELAAGERTVSELAAPFPMSLTAVSKHLRVLEGASLVTRERRGREQHCRLVPDPLSGASEWIEHYRGFWEARLDALEGLLKDKPAGAVMPPGAGAVKRAVK